MRSLFRQVGPFVLAAAVTCPVLLAGCAAHVRYYDAGYNDYHVWDRNEVVYYGRWENEGHREHRDFNRRSDPEKKEYWSWRHSQK
jgi:hypothetical protein